MDTTVSAKAAAASSGTTDAIERRPLARVIRDNLQGSGDNPLDCLAGARESITELIAFLLDHHELPEAVALEFEAALAHVAAAEAHVRMAATRCG